MAGIKEARVFARHLAYGVIRVPGRLTEDDAYSEAEVAIIRNAIISFDPDATFIGVGVVTGTVHDNNGNAVGKY